MFDDILYRSVTNSSKIDRSFEIIFNWLFYAVSITIILGQLGYSPMALFLSISGVILAFAFMIGSASSKYFEGLLFILVRRPYAIGDGIHVMGRYLLACMHMFVLEKSEFMCFHVFDTPFLFTSTRRGDGGYVCGSPILVCRRRDPVYNICPLHVYRRKGNPIKWIIGKFSHHKFEQVSAGMDVHLAQVSC